MEKPVPMDRLLCGDVGYGKTEVAIRAAFKAVMDGMQVAVLAPTTVLAQQHLLTFTQRMASFGVNIEMLSRFRSAKEQREIIKKLAAGQIDIIIGTHRILSPGHLLPVPGAPHHRRGTALWGAQKEKMSSGAPH